MVARTLGILVATALLTVSSPSAALQPLGAFVASGHARNVDEREAALTTAQRTAEVGVARAGILPSLGVRGVYTRNQYEVAFTLPFGDTAQRIIITPRDQLDAFINLTVPVVDLGAYGRFRAARATSEAAALAERASSLVVEGQIATAYYRLIGGDAVSAAARRALEVSQANAAIVEDRRAAGAASELDVQRALADVARAQQQVEDAALAVKLAARSLATLSGLEPASSTMPSVDDSLTPETDLASWMAQGAAAPARRAAEAGSHAAEEARRATTWSLLPALSLAAEQRITNAKSFVGRNAFYALTANLTWNLDAGVASRVTAQRAATDIIETQAERARLQTADQIYEAWHRVHAALARSTAARAEAAAASKAAELAKVRYEGGAATQLEVLSAQRDAFSAEVSRIQADADLAFARTQLRLSAGKPITARNP